MQTIFETPIVDNKELGRIPLKDALIPCHRSSAKTLNLWELVLTFHPEKLPVREQVLDWYDFIDEDWKKDLGINLRYKLANLIQNICSRGKPYAISRRINKNESGNFGLAESGY